MKQQTTLWYTRRQDRAIRGPFAESVIINHLLLGRLSANDEVSTDQVNWQRIYNQPQLQSNHDFSSEEQAKKHLDERDGFDRRYPLSAEEKPIPQRRHNTRRTDEDDSEIQRRQLRTLIMKKFRQGEQSIFWPLVITFSIMTLIFILTIIYAKPLPSPLGNCDAPATSNVNWTNCLKPQLNLHDKVLSHAQLRNSQLVGSNLMNTILNNADMAYADLRFTNLSYSQLQDSLLLGANLKNADLSYADLSNADVSYADLTGANLGGSKLDNARFDHAIWIDGQICAVQSIGECIINIGYPKP
tara:strand:- start:475807 stop:476706 length:900 start_codon:yes stop_codon:yes gene_type:complete